MIKLEKPDPARIPIAIYIRWTWSKTFPASEDAVDVFPIRAFEDCVKARNERHDVRLGKETFSVNYVLTVDAAGASLTYDPKTSDPRVLPGTLRLEFSDATRHEPKSATWTPRDGKCAQVKKFDAKYLHLDPGAHYSGPGPSSKRREVRNATVREGQSEFREALMHIYGRKCCVSSCAVEAILEAAHIDRYEGEHSNHYKNGLLLRADLHKLFDARLLAVDPKSLKVRLAPELRADKHYGVLEGESIRIEGPHGPSLDALRRHLESAPWYRASAVDALRQNEPGTSRPMPAARARAERRRAVRVTAKRPSANT